MFSCWLGAAALQVLMGCSLGGHLSLVNTRTGQVIIFWGLVGWQHLVNCIVNMMVHDKGLWECILVKPCGLLTEPCWAADRCQRRGAKIGVWIRGCTELSKGIKGQFHCFIVLLRAVLRCQCFYTSVCSPDSVMELPGSKDKCSSKANEPTGNRSLKPWKMMEIIAYFFPL